MSRSLDADLDRIVETLRARGDAVAVILFGSRARGTARADSDVDVGVVLAPRTLAGRPRREQAERIDEVMRQAQRAAPGVDLDVVVLNAAHPLAAWDAVRSGQVLWARGRGELADFAVWALGRYEDWKHLHAIEMREVRRRLSLPARA